MQPAVAKNENVLVIDLVARADAERHQRRQQRVGARRDGDGVRDAEVGGELRSSASTSGPHDEPLAVADARDRGEDLVAQRPVLRLEIEERHGDARSPDVIERRSPARPTARDRCPGCPPCPARCCSCSGSARPAPPHRPTGRP